MAANEWPHGAGLKKLGAAAEEFNFFQAARLLSAHPVEGGKPLSIRFRGSNSLALKPNFVESVRFSETKENMVAELTANGFHLLGQQGPVPQTFSAQIADEKQNGNAGPEAFVDIFNDRILKSVFEVKKRFDPLLFNGTQNDLELFKLFEAISGIAEKTNFESRLPTRFGRFWRLYSGALANRRVNYSLLKNLLSDLLGTVTTIKSAEGGWKNLEPDQQATLDGKCSLGGDHALGKRFWRHSSAIRIILEAKDIETFEALLPEGEIHDDLVSLLCVLSDSRFEVVLEVKLSQSEIPCSDSPRIQRLGRTSWLRAKKDGPITDRSVQVHLDRGTMLNSLRKAV